MLYCVQLAEHFTSPNTPWSQRVHITDFLLYCSLFAKLDLTRTTNSKLLNFKPATMYNKGSYSTH